MLRVYFLFFNVRITLQVMEKLYEYEKKCYNTQCILILHNIDNDTTFDITC